MQVYVVDPKTYDGVMTDIANLGQLTGSTEQAQQVADTMQQAKDDVQAKVGVRGQGGDLPRDLQQAADDRRLETFIDDMITLAGGTNIGATAGPGFPNFSTEVLFKEDPDVYIADSGSMSKPGDIAKRAGFAELTAVKDGHVYVIDDNLIARPGPRLAQGLQELAEMIHPEACSRAVTRLARTSVWPGIALSGGRLRRVPAGLARLRTGLVVARRSSGTS